METLGERLERDLNTALMRLRHLDGTLAGEELLGPSGSHASFADEVDAIHASESREMGFATRGRLMERVNRLSMALDRLNLGEYGTCVECDETISPARLRAMPEVQTCVRCQDRLERTRRGSTREATGPEPQFAEELMDD
jgi:DnaK suppressor protein